MVYSTFIWLHVGSKRAPAIRYFAMPEYDCTTDMLDVKKPQLVFKTHSNEVSNYYLMLLAEVGYMHLSRNGSV
jgi:hypothetical protein